MPDWYGTTGRDDLVGGSGETQYSTTIEDITLCSVEPFTDDEREALAIYFRLLRKAREDKRRPPECECDEPCCQWCEIHGDTGNRPDPECTCAMTESSMTTCAVHGYNAPES